MTRDRLGIDTNVLIYAHIASLPQHPKVRRYLLDLLADESVELVLTPAVLHEFLHVTTDVRRFDPPASMGQALAIARLYLEHSNTHCLATDEASAGLALELMERHDLGRKRLGDTLFAATLLHHGVRRLATCNPRDFKIFVDLKVIDPLSLDP